MKKENKPLNNKNTFNLFITMPILEAACMLLSQTQSHFDNIVSSKDAKLMYILNVFNKYAPFVVVNLVICRMVIHLKIIETWYTCKWIEETDRTKKYTLQSKQ